MASIILSGRRFDAEQMVAPAVRSMPAYHRETPPATVPPREIRLDWNESPYGPSPKARSALGSFSSFNRYPPIDAGPLRSALGCYIGAPTDQVICGAGLDDVLSTLSLTLLVPGDRVIISEPTFGVYRPLFSGHGAEVVDVPLVEQWQLNVEGLLATVDERTKLIVICNPNNPTGTLFDPASIERVCAEAPCVVAIDEAYAEFAGIAHRPLMDRYPNVLVLRTMSKFAGLAGMRVGYGVFPETLVEYALRVMPAFANVAAPSAAAAIASLDDLPYLRDIVARIVADRDALAGRLRQLSGVEPVTSVTNFLLVKLPVPQAGPIVAELARRGVFVRHFARPDLGLLPYLRVSIGTAEENAVFADELAASLRETAA